MRTTRAAARVPEARGSTGNYGALSSSAPEIHNEGAITSLISLGTIQNGYHLYNTSLIETLTNVRPGGVADAELPTWRRQCSAAVAKPAVSALAYGSFRQTRLAGARMRGDTAARRFELVVGDSKMSFALYMIGVACVVGGLAWGLVAAHVPHTYVAIACLIALGLGVMGGVSRTRTKDISE